MSPTSYQAAPPRTVTISDGHAGVKLRQEGAIGAKLPLRVLTLRRSKEDRSEKCYHSLYGV